MSRCFSARLPVRILTIRSRSQVTARAFARQLDRDFKGVRVAWWKGLGGIPFEPEIRRVVNANRQVFENLGCAVEEAEPDFAGVDQAFPALRYVSNHPRYAELVRQNAEWVKDTIKYEVTEAERLTGVEIGRALARQARMYEQSREFFTRYEYFVLPVTQVAPFDVNTPYPTQIDGTAMSSYIDWMRSCWYVTFMANPAISVPAGFTAAGLPVASRSSVVTATSGACCRSRMRSSRRRQHGKRRPAALNA